MYVKYVKCFFVRCLHFVHRTQCHYQWAELVWECGCVSHYPLVLYCLSYKFVPFRVNRIQSARTKSTQIPRVGTQHTHTARLHQSFVSFISVCFFLFFPFSSTKLFHDPFHSIRFRSDAFATFYEHLYDATRSEKDSKTNSVSFAGCLYRMQSHSFCVCWLLGCM